MDWFWVVTLQWRDAHGLSTNTVTGVISVDAACRLVTRDAAYKSVVTEARRVLGTGPREPAVVLFYSLEPAVLAQGQGAGQ